MSIRRLSIRDLELINAVAEYDSVSDVCSISQPALRGYLRHRAKKHSNAKWPVFKLLSAESLNENGNYSEYCILFWDSRNLLPVYPLPKP